jgi:hypothetical protein
MLKIVLSIFIFCIVLFIYLHIQYHLKTSNELEIYEYNDSSKEKIEQICNLRQPVLFDLNNENTHSIIDTTNITYLLKNYPTFDINVRNTNDSDDITEDELYIPLSVQLADKLFKDDTSSSFYTENNMDFLNESRAIKHFQYKDDHIRPALVCNCYYDIISGSNSTCTPFKYDINFRNYYLVTSGYVKIKLCPPEFIKYLHVDYDYENFEFKSPINPWKTQEKYKSDFQKIKCMEIIVETGKMLYVPSYWWYSIQFSKNSSVSSFKYRTYMNNMAILPHIFMNVLQSQNIKRKFLKSIDLSKKHSLDTLVNKKIENEEKDDKKIEVIEVIDNNTNNNNIIDVNISNNSTNNLDDNHTLTINTDNNNITNNK